MAREGRPEDCFEMELVATTSKAKLSNGDVPANKFARKVYSYILSNKGSAVAGITFTIEKNNTVVRTIPEIILGAYDSIDEQNGLGLITIPAGHNIKAQVTTGSGPVSVIMRAYDL
ncbi:MAG: hypothetical protein QXG58_06460 [Candidatus Bathyarchaeia archaeon]